MLGCMLGVDYPTRENQDCGAATQRTCENLRAFHTKFNPVVFDGPSARHAVLRHEILLSPAVLVVLMANLRFDAFRKVFLKIHNPRIFHCDGYCLIFSLQRYVGLTCKDVWRGPGVSRARDKRLCQVQTLASEFSLSPRAPRSSPKLPT